MFCMGSSCEQFADDTNLTSINSRADQTEDNSSSSHQPDSFAGGVSVLTHKKPLLETIRRTTLPTPLSIKLAQDALTKVQSHRHLGVIFSHVHDLRWNSHVDYI